MRLHNQFKPLERKEFLSKHVPSLLKSSETNIKTENRLLCLPIYTVTCKVFENGLKAIKFYKNKKRCLFLLVILMKFLVL